MSGSLISTVRQNLHDTSDLETLLYQQFQLASMDVETRNEAQTTMMNILAGKLPVPVAVAANCARRAADPSSVASSSSSSSHYAQRKTVYSSNSLLAMKVLLSRENIAVETQIVDRGDSGSSSGSSSSSSSSGRYKTELCRPFEESGQCKYGEKCQFAHGAKELRSLPRHPKYKTDLCRTYHTIGFCPYGPRCHFIHNEDERRLGCIVNKNQQQQQQQQPTPIHRPKWSNLKRLSSLGSSLDSPRSSDSGSPTRLSPTFSEDIFTSSSSSSSSSLPSYPALLINSSSSDDSSSRSSPDLTSSQQQQQQQQQNLTSPLNVHTHLNTVDTVLDLLRLQQQFNQVLSFAEQNYCSNSNNNQQQAMVVEDNFLFRNIYPSCASSTSPGSVESSQNSTYGSSSTPSNTLSLNWIH